MTDSFFLPLKVEIIFAQILDKLQSDYLKFSALIRIENLLKNLTFLVLLELMNYKK